MTQSCYLCIVLSIVASASSRTATCIAVCSARQARDVWGDDGYVSSFAGYPDIDLKVSGVSELAWAAQTLEAYEIASRSDYPDSPITSMSSIFIAAGGVNPPVVWQIRNATSICGEYSSVVNAGNPGGPVDINYGS